MKLILATKNEHKVEEFQRILAPLAGRSSRRMPYARRT